MSNQRSQYQESDKAGLKTLNVLSAGNKFNLWMYQSIKPFLKGNILEIGSGTGNITQFVLADQFRVTASDIRTGYCSMILDRFHDNPCLTEVLLIDIIHPDFDQEYHRIFGTFDTIFALNVMEHIKNDLLAVQNCRKLLRSGGNLVVLVPAFQKLYNLFDQELNHFRRYTGTNLKKLLITADFSVTEIHYFNFAGIAAWWLSGSILRNKTIPATQMSLYNRLVPILKLMDLIMMNKLGLSLITVGKKKQPLNRTASLSK
jgi:SAM-dependent methyltransferase